MIEFPVFCSCFYNGNDTRPITDVSDLRILLDIGTENDVFTDHVKWGSGDDLLVVSYFLLFIISIPLFLLRGVPNVVRVPNLEKGDEGGHGPACEEVMDPHLSYHETRW